MIGDTGIKYYYRYFRLNIYGGAKHVVVYISDKLYIIYWEQYFNIDSKIIIFTHCTLQWQLK